MMNVIIQWLLEVTITVLMSVPGHTNNSADLRGNFLVNKKCAFHHCELHNRLVLTLDNCYLNLLSI